MRIAEYKQIDVEVKESQMPILDEEGNETGEFETIRKEVPTMGPVYRDATLEEEAEIQKMEDIPPVPTIEEEVNLLKGQNKELKEKNDFLEECLIEIGNIIYS